MHELIELDAPNDHACATPVIERWNVLEPISGRWSWLSVYRCCSQVVAEPAEGGAADGDEVQQAA